MLKIKIFLFLLPCSIFSQSITGKIFDSESTVKGAQVINSTQNNTIFTNEKGTFTMKASVGDSLHFKSLFHHDKHIKLSKTDFNDVLVIELKKEVNALGEVRLTTDAKPKAFDPIDYTQQVSLNLKEDMKRNPHLYKPLPSGGGFNIFAVVEETVMLLKKKKPKTNPITFINYKTYDSLFSQDSFFNKTLLKENLHITEALKPLFFDYCDAQGLNTKLLKKANQFILLDSLLYLSKTFKTSLESSKKE
ncbi:hypothetical protein ACFFU9_07165 [Mariniflexile ostreae]|uniref:Carboxypeptidase-like protein n=1 Tax=Mariniflexile ostreae TaxID=1520892 RepID=A0ABV5FAQ2_9FLAO